MNNETVGISTIIVGVVIVVGAVRGTWKKIFADVISTGSNSSGGSSSSGNGSSSGPSIGGVKIPSPPSIGGIPSFPFNPANPVPALPIKICWKGPIPYPCGVQVGPFGAGFNYTQPPGELINTNGQGMVIY